MLRQMGVDEIYLGKSQKFLTVVSDLESGEPLWLKSGTGFCLLRTSTSIDAARYAVQLAIAREFAHVSTVQ